MVGKKLGLTFIDSSKKFLLNSVSVKCNLSNLLLTCTSEMLYKNDTDENAEALFSFPLEGTCVVYHFEAIIDGKSIAGVCKELEEAKNLYKVATEDGQKAALIERSNSMTDVFKCRIGNIPKNSEAKIVLKFIMELKISLSKSDCDDVDRFSLCLPLILKPRYTPLGYTGDSGVLHVDNVYQYTFKAKFQGTKEVKNIFSLNNQLNVIIDDGSRKSGQIILESEYDGSHDLDIYIDYVKMKIPSVLYEIGSASKSFTGSKENGAFYKTDVAMLNFLPEFEKKHEAANKLEVVIVVDQSGSMEGSNIQHAKECLLVFLKSLPTSCKFQIYGFGTTFNKVFPSPQFYNDQSIEIAMTYQRNLKADLGGTELMNPLKDLYESSLSNDYTRVVFLLTDGDVGNQDEVFRLVRQNNLFTRLFTVGIGHGVSTSLVEKVAESGNGKSAFVRDSKTLSSTVIELLDIALSCDQFTECKIEWQCPDNVSVVMVPSIVGPIFSNYFLTTFCMISELEEEQLIKCHLTGKVNGISMKLSLDIKSKDGISDDEFKVHRLLAKYKIDEMTNQIDDGNESLKKSLIQLSVEVNMVSNYTTFVAIEQGAKDHILAVENYEAPVAMACYSLPTCLGIKKSEAMVNKCYLSEERKKCKKKSKGGLFNKCFGKPNKLSTSAAFEDEADDEMCREQMEEINKDIFLYLAEMQNINGSWTMDDDILKKLTLDYSKIKETKEDNISDDMWMTIIIYQYLLVKLSSRENEWRLLAKKAKQWLTSSFNDSIKMEKLLEQGLTMI